MNTKRLTLVLTTVGLLMAVTVLLQGQQASDITGKISTSERPAIAITV